MKLSKKMQLSNRNNIKYILYSFPLFMIPDYSYAGNIFGNFIGIGFDGEQSIYLGGKFQSTPTPTGNYSYGSFYASFENGIGVQVGSIANIHFSLSLNSVLYGEQRNDIKELSDIDKLDNDINYNLTAATNITRNIFSLNISKERVIDKGGISTILTYSYLLTKKRWIFIPHVSVSYQDKYLTRYRYGVKQHETKPGRAYYQPDYSINYSAGLYIEYVTSKKYSIVGNINYSNYDTKITNSPIVAKKSTNSIFVGFNYTF